MNFQEAYAYFVPYWNSPFRFYHTKNHLDSLLRGSDSIELKYFSLFHDIIYAPYSDTNEEDSVGFFKKHMDSFNDLTNEGKKLVIDMIMATKTHDLTENHLINKALNLDMEILHSPFNELLEYECLIFKEYQKYNIQDYVKGRINFLKKHIDIGDILYLKKYLENKRYSIGIYPGSFDPFHVGHLDILKKAERMFDKVIIVRANNPSKQAPVSLMPKTLPNQIIEHKGLISKLFNDNNHDYTLIRGIRNEYDIASEMNYMAWVNEIDKNIKFVHIFCDQENIKVSSTALKNFQKINEFNSNKWIVP